MTDNENPSTGNEPKKEKKPRNWAKVNTVLLVIVIVILLTSVSLTTVFVPEDNSEEQMDEININVNTILEQNELLKIQNQELMQQNNYIMSQNDQILLNINKLNTTFADRFNSIDAKLISNDVKLTDIQNKMDVMNLQLEENNNAIATLMSAITVLQNNTADLTLKIGEVYEMQVTINGSVYTLQQTVNEQNEIILNLVDEVNNNTVQLGVIDASVNELIVTVDGLEVKIDAQTVMLVNLTEQMTEVQNQLALFYELLEAISNSTTDCTELLNLLETQMTVVMTDIDNIQTVLNKVACQVNAIYKLIPPCFFMCKPPC